MKQHRLIYRLAANLGEGSFRCKGFRKGWVTIRQNEDYFTIKWTSHRDWHSRRFCTGCSRRSFDMDVNRHKIISIFEYIINVWLVHNNNDKEKFINYMKEALNRAIEYRDRPNIWKKLLFWK